MKTRFFDGIKNNNNLNIEKNNQISTLKNELDPEIIELIKKKDNEKNELSFAANFVKDYVNVLKSEMENNYDDDNDNFPLLSSIKLDSKKKRINSSQFLSLNNNIKKNENINHSNLNYFDKNENTNKNFIKKFSKKGSYQNIKSNKIGLFKEDAMNNLNVFSREKTHINNLKNKLSEIQKKNELKFHYNKPVLKNKSHQNIKAFKINLANEEYNKNLISIPSSKKTNLKNQMRNEVSNKYSNNFLNKRSAQNIKHYKGNKFNFNNDLSISLTKKRSSNNINYYLPNFFNKSNNEQINENKNKNKQHLNLLLNKKSSHQNIKHYKLNFPQEEFVNLEKRKSFEINFDEKNSDNNSKFDNESDKLSSKDNYSEDNDKITEINTKSFLHKKDNIIKKKVLKSYVRQPKSFSHKKFVKFNSIQSNKTIKSKNSIKNSKTHIYNIKKINNYYDTDNENELLYRKTGITNKNKYLLNEIKKEIKESIIGESTLIHNIDTKTSFFDKIHQKNEEGINNIPKEEINIIEQRYRNLQKKGYVYDSLDDEENIDEQMNLFYLDPNSYYVILFDSFILISSIFNLIYIPFFLGYNKVYCIDNFLKWDFIVELIINIVYILDLFFSFFIAFYNFDEVLNTNLHDIAQKYIHNWFFWDLIQAIPIKSLLSIFDNKCKNKDFYNTTLYHHNFYYIFICIRLIKIIKVLHNNKFIEKILDLFNETTHYINFFKIYKNLFIFFISIHIVANIFIFIGRIDYPNWIINYGYDDCSYIKLYLISIYYSITTLTTVGYGDLLCITYKEKIFGLFLEIFGVIAYSWVVSSISNYVQGINEKNENYEKKCKILDNIKISHPQLSDDLYDRINRYLKYKQDNEKSDKKIIFESLPVGLSNMLVYEMYKEIINNFIFFKNFDNIDFIAKVVLNFNPILALRNDILINYDELVEDIIFVRKGKLSLELPLVLKPNKSTVKPNNKSKLENTLIYQKKQQEYYNMFSRTKGLNKKDSLKKKSEEEIQVFKILEIRKNEHFGDILMFLNLKSPLTLRTKTKKAELFYLHKTAAIEISTSYPLIWKQINKKSLYNYEQIKKLMYKVLKIFNNSQIKNVSTIDEEYNLYSSSSSDSIISENQSSFSLTDSNSSKYKANQETKNKKIESLLTINEIDDNEGSKNNLYQDINEVNSDDSSKKVNSVINKELTHEYNEHFKNSHSNSDSKNETNNNNKYNLTPFRPEEINEEIYPNDNYYLFNENESLNDDRKSIVNNDSLLKNENNFYFNKNNFINILYNNNNNISVCSTEISFTLNSEYENINELSDYSYSKDKTLQEKVIDVLKGKDEKEKDKDDKEGDFMSIKLMRKGYNFSDDLMKNKRRNQKENSISFFKMGEKMDSIWNKFQNNEESNNGKLRVEKKRKNSHSKASKVNLKSTQFSKRKSILDSINKNIERSQINLNNPELYYAEYFHNIITQNTKLKENKVLNKEEEKFMIKLQKKSTFCSMNIQQNNLKFSMLPGNM